jgi:hypothetical protein
VAAMAGGMPMRDDEPRVRTDRRVDHSIKVDPTSRYWDGIRI